MKAAGLLLLALSALANAAPARLGYVELTLGSKVRSFTAKAG